MGMCAGPTTEIWRDPSVELQICASSMSFMLDMYVQRMLEDVCRDIGFRAEVTRARWRTLSI
jgi:hypothetical protein